MTSEQFAHGCRSSASGRAMSRFVIGGALGLGAVVQAARVDAASALAPWTLPHELARLCSRSSCTAPARSAAASRTTNERTRGSGEGGGVSEQFRFAPNLSADRRCRARRAPASSPSGIVPRPRGGRMARVRRERVGRAFRANWLDELAPAFSARAPRRATAAQRRRRGHRRHDGTAARPVRRAADDARQGAQRAGARRCAARDASGMPVAPVFWAATDDADFDEAAVVSVALDGRCAGVAARAHAPPPERRWRDAPLDGRRARRALRGSLRDASGSASHAVVPRAAR